jgi:signal transduction histidine kinase
MRGDRFVLDAPPELRGFGDVAALRYVVENLISNAVKHGDRDTSIWRRVAEDWEPRLPLGT